jgi:hypothetical protein
MVFSPPPQLRYTVADRWLVLKGGRRDRRGNRQFYDIYRNVAAHAEFATAALGWGDTHIENAAQSPPSVGPGNGTVWRARERHIISISSSRVSPVSAIPDDPTDGGRQLATGKGALHGSGTPCGTSRQPLFRPGYAGQA